MASTQASSGGSTLFDDDDEETQYLVASLNDSISSRLDGLCKRFKEDHEKPQLDEQFNSWVVETKNVGFRVAESTKGASSAAASTPTSLPEAFATEEGKKHLAACSSLLGLKSDQRATQLTLCALRDLKDSENLQALLGTRRLMIVVMEYYYRQRSARISVIGELLRQEQDESGAFAATSAKLLGELDEYYSIDGNDRGLFKILLSIACRKVDGQSPIGREQMTKSKGLSAGAPTTLSESVSIASEGYSWHQFAYRCVGSTLNSIHEERIRALEALTAYLYTRVQGGVRRVDYMILLKAFHSADAFFTVSQEDEKLSKLAGLICAECMGLWRACVEESIDSIWVQEHPLLQGLLSSNPGTAEVELDALKTYLHQLPDQSMTVYHQRSVEPRHNAPESLALLSFGLLMMMAYTNIIEATEHGSNLNGYFQDFYQQGQNIVMSASADLCVFDVFHSTMLSLLLDPPQNLSDRRRSDLPYDWLLFGMTSDSSSMETTDDADLIGMEMDGASLIYGSVGVELTSSLIMAFGDSILAPEHNLMHENLIMICDLVSSIYRRSPTLCQRFWVEWDQVTSPSMEKQSRRPLCEILDLSFSIANKTVKAGRLAEKEVVLSSAALQMQLLASWCYSARTVEAAFGVLNPTILGHALGFCGVDPHSDESFKQNKLRFLSSLASMTRLGSSKSCRNKVRDVLGMSTPSLLFKVIQSSDARCSELALEIAANLLQGAPVEWTLQFASGMQSLVDRNRFEQNEALYPIARIFNAMAMSIPDVIVCERISGSDADVYLELLWGGVLRLSKELPRCLSHISTESVPLKAVTSILDFLLSLLENLASTVTSRKANQALELRKAIVELLSTHVGEALMFYALQPLSLSIACSVESYAEERSILRSASMQESDLSSRFGAWSTFTAGSSSLTKQSETQAKVHELVANVAVNIGKIVEYIGELNEVLCVVSKAMGLLRLWAINAEEIAKREAGTVQQIERLFSISPQKLLFLTAALPNPMRAKTDVKILYESASPSNFQLLLKYIKNGMWPFNLSMLALDFSHACITHMKSNSSQGGTLKEIVQRSDLFGLLLPVAAGEADATATNSDEARETRISTILAFRLAAATIEALPTVDATSRDAVRKILSAAFNGTERACNKLHSLRQAKQRLTLKSEPLDHLLFGTACLNFLSSVWDDAGLLEDELKLTDQYDNHRGAFTALAKVLLQHAHSESPIETAASGCLCSFLAGAVHFLKVATEVALAKEQTKTSMFVEIMNENALQLIMMPQKFLTVAIASPPTTTVLSLRGSPHTLFSQFPVVAVGGDTLGFLNVDVTSMATSLPFEAKEALFTLALSHYNSKSQVNLQSQFKEFAGVLLQLSKSSQHSQSPTGALVQQNSHSNKYLDGARETLRVIKANVINVESASLDASSVMTIGVNDIAQMCESTATVIGLLSAANLSDEKHNPDVLTELLDLIGFSSTKLQNILETNADVCCRVEQNLLTAACLILMSNPSSITSDVIHQLLQVIHHLLLQLLEMKHAEGSTLKTIVVLLTLMLEGGTDFVDGKLVNLLVRHANTHSVSGRSGQIEEEKMQVLESIVDFFQSSMESPSEKMLELISNGALQQLLTQNPIIELAGRKWGFPDGNANGLSTNAKLRGYIPESHGMQSGKSTSFVSGRSDPQHALWRSALRCFREFCRSSRSKERYQSLVSDFILAHHQMMLACLRTIESTAFTHNTLLEATHILSLLSEYCSGPYRDRRTLELISSYFVLESTKLVARLANFLGASSASRELFNSMGDSDSGSEDQLDLTSRMSPFNRAPHNARHEAIRYSHYASRFCTAVTRDEISSAKGKGLDDLRDQSATALEKHGKAMMNSEFARRMELSAAELLFATLSLLWGLHPSKSSFVMFHHHQNSIDAMPLVKEGMVIAFCSDQESSRKWNLKYIHFAEVLAVNTIDRAWFVRSLQTGESEIVKAAQIVGMEEQSKRRCVLRFASAADSATELENDSQSTSVGHLVLALRWCSSSPGCSAVSRLAGLASCFLGAETEMHKLIGSSLSKSREPEFLEKLYGQLLDLYGDNPESGSRGRLSGILDKKSWATIRQQLQFELETAEKARDSMVVEDEGLFLRNSGAGNPFHALRMAY